MNLPNFLTTIRFALIPFFLAVFFSPLGNATLMATYIFIFAGITDILDGYIAKKYNMITKWGQAMDPVADKLMQLTVIISFTMKNYLPLWVILVIGIKELILIVGGAFLYSKREKIVIPANKYGKIATVALYIAILAIAFGFTYGKFLIVIALAIAAYALFRYVVIGLGEIKNANSKTI